MGYIAVVDYDVGNLMSVNNAMHYLGFETKVTAEPEELERADAMILPGVGAFPLFAGLGEGCYVYFVHSFCGNTADPKYVIASTDYGTQVTAAVQNGTVFGTQFHPEKSGEIGMQILRNFGGLTR